MKGRARLPFALFALVLACKEGRATRAECDAMIERYLDLTIAEDPKLAGLTAGPASVAREMKRAVKKGEKPFRKALDRCDEITSGERDCALEAKTAAAWEACVH